MEKETIETIAELFSLTRIFSAFLVLASAWGMIRILLWLSQTLARQLGRYRLRITRFFPVIRLFTWTTAIYIVVVYIFQPQANAVLALSASAGIAIGLAAQDLVRNVISGILILFDQPFRVGDMIQVGEFYGEVTSIGLRSVRIHTFDDSVISLPNSLLFSQAVSNSNAGALNELVVVEFRVPAHLDIATVKQLAWEAAASSPYTYMKKPITVLVEDEFDRTFLSRFKVKAYVLDIRFERLLASDVSQRIKQELTARGWINESLVMGLR